VRMSLAGARYYTIFRKFHQLDDKKGCLSRFLFRGACLSVALVIKAPRGQEQEEEEREITLK